MPSEKFTKVSDEIQHRSGQNVRIQRKRRIVKVKGLCIELGKVTSYACSVLGDWAGFTVDVIYNVVTLL